MADVLGYWQYVRTFGLSLLCTPGNDVESTTGLAGAGCKAILFATGLGTPTGNPICRVVKLSGNTNWAKRLPYIIELVAGPLSVVKRLCRDLGRSSRSMS
ncbi:UxaA family hydrolase [Rufibacter tibetensis]|uniref:UxaA family hydrolase n=1 Tax=Rufibacter tibetensis TaxID=512763 RepID=UPI0009005298